MNQIECPCDSCDVVNCYGDVLKDAPADPCGRYLAWERGELAEYDAAEAAEIAGDAERDER